MTKISYNKSCYDHKTRVVYHGLTALFSIRILWSAHNFINPRNHTRSEESYLVSVRCSERLPGRGPTPSGERWQSGPPQGRSHGYSWWPCRTSRQRRRPSSPAKRCSRIFPAIALPFPETKISWKFLKEKFPENSWRRNFPSNTIALQ